MPSIAPPLVVRPLPSILSVSHLETLEISPPVPIIDGLIECGSKMMVVGSSKSHKSWNLLFLSVCLSSPTPTWLHMPVHHCKVLYINFEIQSWFFRERLRAIANAMKLDLTLNQSLDVWNLRGHSQDETKLVQAFKERLQGKHSYKLVVVDPFYKFSGAGKVENCAEDIASVMRAMDTVTVDLDVAVVFAHHSPKGDVSERSVVDRGAGSGVFGRDPDVIMSVLELKNSPNRFIAEFALRNHPPKEPLGLRWEFPFMRVDKEVEKPKAGRKPVHDRQKLLALLDPKGAAMASSEWQKLAKERLDISGSSYRRLRKSLVQDGEVAGSGDKFQRVFLLD